MAENVYLGEKVRLINISDFDANTLSQLGVKVGDTGVVIRAYSNINQKRCWVYLPHKHVCYSICINDLEGAGRYSSRHIHTLIKTLQSQYSNENLAITSIVDGLRKAESIFRKLE